MNKLVGISEVAKLINLVDPVTKKPQNYVLRYWEQKFKEIRPKKINSRRYYSPKQVEVIKLIKFLLKNKGMTISGVQNIIRSDINKLDVYNFNSLKAGYHKETLQKKSIRILEKLNKLKKYGKKNSS